MYQPLGLSFSYSCLRDSACPDLYILCVCVSFLLFKNLINLKAPASINQSLVLILCTETCLVMLLGTCVVLRIQCGSAKSKTCNLPTGLTLCLVCFIGLTMSYWLYSTMNDDYYHNDKIMADSGMS